VLVGAAEVMIQEQINTMYSPLRLRNVGYTYRFSIALSLAAALVREGAVVTAGAGAEAHPDCFHINLLVLSSLEFKIKGKSYRQHIWTSSIIKFTGSTRIIEGYPGGGGVVEIAPRCAVVVYGLERLACFVAETALLACLCV
jgi:hypothetical protein